MTAGSVPVAGLHTYERTNYPPGCHKPGRVSSPGRRGPLPLPSLLLCLSYGWSYSAKDGRRRVFGCVEKTRIRDHGHRGGFVRKIETCPTVLFYSNSKFYVSRSILATVSWHLLSFLAIPCSTHPLGIRATGVRVVATSAQCDGIWNLCCFSRQWLMGLSPLSPGISGPHFPLSSAEFL